MRLFSPKRKNLRVFHGIQIPAELLEKRGAKLGERLGRVLFSTYQVMLAGCAVYWRRPTCFLAPFPPCAKSRWRHVCISRRLRLDWDMVREMHLQGVWYAGAGTHSAIDALLGLKRGHGKKYKPRLKSTTHATLCQVSRRGEFRGRAMPAFRALLGYGPANGTTTCWKRFGTGRAITMRWEMP